MNEYKLSVGHAAPPRDDFKELGTVEAPNAQTAIRHGQEKVKELEAMGENAPKAMGTVVAERIDGDEPDTTEDDE